MLSSYSFFAGSTAALVLVLAALLLHPAPTHAQQQQRSCANSTLGLGQTSEVFGPLRKLCFDRDGGNGRAARIHHIYMNELFLHFLWRTCGLNNEVRGRKALLTRNARAMITGFLMIFMVLRACKH